MRLPIASSVALLVAMGATSASAQTVVAGSGLSIARKVLLTGAGALHGLDVYNKTGDVFVISGAGKNLHQLKPDNSFATIASNIGSFVGVLSDLKVGPDGNIYAVSTSGANVGTIQVFSTFGVPQPHLAKTAGGSHGRKRRRL